MVIHHRLERELEEFKGYDACVLVARDISPTSGLISALAGAGDVILSDALNHASIIDGCRLSRAETIVYRHRDLESLADAVERGPRRRGPDRLGEDAAPQRCLAQRDGLAGVADDQGHDRHLAW